MCLTYEGFGDEFHNPVWYAPESSFEDPSIQDLWDQGSSKLRKVLSDVVASDQDDHDTRPHGSRGRVSISYTGTVLCTERKTIP